MWCCMVAVARVVGDVDFYEIGCGIGGFTTAWESLGGEVTAAVDNSPAAVEMYLQMGHSSTNVHEADLSLMEELVCSSDSILATSIQCQDNSTLGSNGAGARKGWQHGQHRKAYHTWIWLLNVLKHKGTLPRALVWENVLGMLSTNGGADMRAFLEQLHGLG
jgi:DNA (cytosine-5)-methyltransferase 1